MFSLAMNPEKARELHGTAETSECTMCGKLCSVKANNDCVTLLGKKER
jgi:thiamine biosynthesis protein ThiC